MEDRYNVECCEFIHAHDEIVEKVRRELPNIRECFHNFRNGLWKFSRRAIRDFLSSFVTLCELHRQLNYRASDYEA